VVAHLSQQLTPLGALSEPTRRALYEYVASQPSPVSREQVADAAGMALHSVRFHLEKLVDAGLLEVEQRRLSGRSGPGAGRPSKLYRRSSHPISVSIPPRSYDLAGRMLAAAIERADDEDLPVRDALHLVAREEGLRLAREAAAGSQDPGSQDPGSQDPGSQDPGSQGPGSAGPGGPVDALGRVTAVLAGHGFEPQVTGDSATLANCPFDRLAAEHTELVCGMNLCLVAGILDGLRITSVEARLAPAPGRCCVALSPASAPASAAVRAGRP
jgi:predicted ArsR family transcriptional regulator